MIAVEPVSTHGIGRRVAARFALLAFGLYHLPLFLNNYPSLGGGGFRSEGLAIDWGHVFGHVGLWVARNVFDLSGPMPDALSGDNGDTAEEFCRLFVAIVVAAIGAALWTALDRRRPRAAWTEDALRVLLRYSIALGLASYAIAKLIPVQFPPLTAPALEYRLAEMHPMTLLWSAMRYSSPYSTFAGAMELLAVGLLCFRRTTTLGALLCVPVMLNVALMNYCYRVPVKLFSTMIVVSALVIVAFDARRLIDLLLRHRAIPAMPPRPPFASARWNRWRWAVKALVVGSVLASSVAAMTQPGARDDRGLAGTWEVTSFVDGSRELARTGEPARWRRLAIGDGRAVVRLESDALQFCRLSDALTCGDAPAATLHWTLAGDELRLDGRRGDAPLTLTLRRAPESRLLTTPFQWTYD